MKYYRIRHSIDSKIIGRKYPQVEKVLIPTTWDDPLFIQSFVGKEAPFNVLLPKPILYKRSKLTDLISAATVGLSLNLVVSEKFYSIIKGYKSFGIQFFEINLTESNGDKHLYWILHSCNSYYEILNLKESEIGYYADMQYTKRIKLIEPDNYIGLRSEINNYNENIISDPNFNQNFCIPHIKFKEDNEIDFFSLQYIHGGIGFFVSQKLKNEIEKERFSGMVFTEPNERYP